MKPRPHTTPMAATDSVLSRKPSDIQTCGVTCAFAAANLAALLGLGAVGLYVLLALDFSDYFEPYAPPANVRLVANAFCLVIAALIGASAVWHFLMTYAAARWLGTRFQRVRRGDTQLVTLVVASPLIAVFVAIAVILAPPSHSLLWLLPIVPIEALALAGGWLGQRQRTRPLPANLHRLQVGCGFTWVSIANFVIYYGLVSLWLALLSALLDADSSPTASASAEVSPWLLMFPPFVLYALLQVGVTYAATRRWYQRPPSVARWWVSVGVALGLTLVPMTLCMLTIGIKLLEPTVLVLHLALLIVAAVVGGLSAVYATRQHRLLKDSFHTTP